ncbi:MAG: putative dehydrogenase [Hyphomicrobiaceae bacterium]|jgi:predicted dehydrogenase
MSNMSKTPEIPLRVAVIGVGYLGGFHASKYAALPDVRLACVYDTDPQRAKEVADLYGTEVAPTLEAAFAAADAVSIAVPTAEHLRVGLAAAEAGLPMLVEKPLAATAAEGRQLVAAAAAAGVLLQVGHLERFNPVFDDVRRIVCEPKFIECHRLSPFAGRGSDTSVVHDVMIHDLDLIAYLVGQPLLDVQAVGVPVLSSHEDICNARLSFKGGAIANVTASRVSLKRERKLRIFQTDAYASVDLDKREVTVARRKPGSPVFDPSAPMDSIDVEVRSFEGADPLADEIAAFVSSVRNGTAIMVDGEAGLAALEMAERVLDAVRAAESYTES